MDHLKEGGVIVFLDADLATLRTRIRNFDTRGIAKRPEQSLEDLFAERFRLYKRYADLTVPSAGLNQDEVCSRIVAELHGNGARIPLSPQEPAE